MTHIVETLRKELRLTIGADNHPKKMLRLGFFMVGAMMFTIPATHAKEVYKWVAEDGTVYFSDKPHDGAEKIKIKKLPTVPALKQQNISQSTDRNKVDDEPVQKYKSIRITAPQSDTAFYSGGGEVVVTLEVQPALRPKDSVRLMLDGQAAGAGSNRIVLKNVDRGSHTLQAQIIRQNKTLLSSEPITFIVHRPTIKRNVAK